MKRSTAIIVSIIGILALLAISGYNGVVKKDENVKNKWALVDTQYQRRLDLIPNLVNTVKGVADFEKSTLTQVVEARAKATSVQIDANDLTPENIAKFQAAQNGVSSALSRLLATVENYPNLKSNENFLELQAQLEGTENRIAVARKDFNDAVQDFNQSIRTFPTAFIAKMAGFSPKAYFQADTGAEKAPTVKF